jgi:putative transposase
VGSRRREVPFRDDGDCESFLHILGLGLARFNTSALANCTMDNHYHLLVQTYRGDLSQRRLHVSGVCT